MSDRKKKIIKVAVFKISGKAGDKKSHYTAYTVWYSTDWEGCAVVEVEAKNGTEAKKIAIARAVEEGFLNE